MTETLANGYLFERTQRELSNEYQHDRVSMVFNKSLYPCALYESSLSIGRVKCAAIEVTKMPLSSPGALEFGILFFFVTFSAMLWLSRDLVVVSGGGNLCTRQKSPPNPN